MIFKENVVVDLLLLAMFLLLFLLPRTGLFAVSKDLVHTLQLEVKVEAPVTACICKHLCHIPVVMLDDGRRVVGKSSEVRWDGVCKSLIGQNVPVYIDEKDKTRSRIGTFSQMWRSPLILGSLCLFFFPLIILDISWYWREFRKMKRPKT